MKNNSQCVARCSIVLAVAVLVLGLRMYAQAPTSGPNVTIRFAPITYIAPGDGPHMYGQYCAACHGDSARGNGPAAPALAVPPTDLTIVPETRLRNVLYDRIAWQTHEAVGMPYWYDSFQALDQLRSQDFSDMRVNTIVFYVKKLQASSAQATGTARAGKQ
jgi:mono/diheme cytochrome c family protein